MNVKGLYFIVKRYSLNDRVQVLFIKVLIGMLIRAIRKETDKKQAQQKLLSEGGTAGMEKTCQITLSKTHVNEAFNFNLTEDYHNMEFCLELEDQLRFKSYLIVTDPRNRIRLQRLVSHGELRYIIGNSPENTSVGGNPGPIPKGVWKCGFYCIYGNFDELFEKPCTIMLRIRCNAAEAAPDVIGNDRWTDYDKEINQLSLNNYDETQLYSDKSKWYAGDFH